MLLSPDGNRQYFCHTEFTVIFPSVLLQSDRLLALVMQLLRDSLTVCGTLAPQEQFVCVRTHTHPHFIHIPVLLAYRANIVTTFIDYSVVDPVHSLNYDPSAFVNPESVRLCAGCLANCSDS